MLVSLSSVDRRPAGRLFVQLPKPVRRFVTAFDDLRYPRVVWERDPGERRAPPLASSPR